MSQKSRFPFAFPGSLAAIPLLLIGAIVMVEGFAGPPAVVQASDPCKAPYNPSINPADFTQPNGQPNKIDNPYFPLKPGTTFIYEGESEGQVELNVVEVTRDTRMILGVRTTVVRDEVKVDGKLVELTFDWYAQDDQGNVWYLGEFSTEYDPATGEVLNHDGSWEAGINGAKPGIIMEAQPKVGDTYRQEFAPDAQDMATVLDLNKDNVSVPYGTFDDVLTTKDFSCIVPAQEHKYYAQGVGLIRAVAIRGSKERPDLELVELVSVKP